MRNATCERSRSHLLPLTRSSYVCVRVRRECVCVYVCTYIVYRFAVGEWIIAHIIGY